ncbi:MAG: DNA replication/repair protein RecF [Chryseolinea sp.]
MYLESLQLLNFKSYEEVNLRFPGRINVLVGKNGSGKTNLLDAIFYLSFTKSAFSPTDQHLIRHDQPYFMIKGDFRVDDQLHDISTSVQVGSKKMFRDGMQDYQKLSDHIGKYPVILVAPDDVELIREGGESRRRFFDSLISQVDHQYLETLMRYNHLLKQRNSLLKMAYDSGSVDWVAVEVYDEALSKAGSYIFEKRKAFMTIFLPVFQQFYQFLTQENETTSLTYDTELHQRDILAGLRDTRQRDLALQRTSFGIHRDDFAFSMGGRDIKRLGSQGQQKSFVISLKLAQYEILKKHKGFKPVLLLDDIFDKLDDLRISRLLSLIKTDLGQLFMTDARPGRTRKLLDQIEVESDIFVIENGKIAR